MLQRANELDNTLIQRKNGFQESLARRIDDTMLRRSNELQGFLAQRVDDTMVQRTEVLQKNLVQEMFNFHNRVIRPLFDGVHGRLAARDRDIRREFQNVNERFDRMDARIDTLDMDVKRGFNNVNERFAHVEDRLDKVETKVDQLEVKIDRVEAKVDRMDVQMSNLERILRNSKIASLNRRVLPMQMYDPDRSPIPLPLTSLPSTALAFYHLKESKNWSKLRNLIEYYRLQEEAIQATAHYDDSFGDTKLEYTEQELEHAISSNAWDFVVVLGGRMGIDCDALHDRVMQIQSISHRDASSKRDASNVGRDKRAAKTHRPLPHRVRPVSEVQQGADVREPSALSKVHWEVDSEKFKQSLDPRMQGNEPLVTPVPKQGLNSSCNFQGEQRGRDP